MNENWISLRKGAHPEYGVLVEVRDEDGVVFKGMRVRTLSTVEHFVNSAGVELGILPAYWKPIP